MSLPKAKAALPPPPPYIVHPSSLHTHSLILLHGLGSNGEKFGTELLETGVTTAGKSLAQRFPGAKFIFPTSRRRRSTAFGRSMLTQWFDIVRLGDPSYRNERQIQGLSESVKEILDLLHAEHYDYGIPYANIVLGGLSQGCATSLTTLLCLDHPIGGFVGMSGYLPFQKELAETVEDVNMDKDDPFSREDPDGTPLSPASKMVAFERELLELLPVGEPNAVATAYLTPVFLGHGAYDEKVPVGLGEAMVNTISAGGYTVSYKVYAGLGHWYKIPDEIDDVVKFLCDDAGWEIAAV